MNDKCIVVDIDIAGSIDIQNGCSWHTLALVMIHSVCRDYSAEIAAATERRVGRGHTVHQAVRVIPPIHAELLQILRLLIGSVLDESLSAVGAWVLQCSILLRGCTLPDL